MSLRCTDHLIQEHRIILRAIFVLSALVDLAKESRTPDAEDVESLLNFFKRFADDHHQLKEETVLFPELRNTDVAKTKGALHQMMFEHERERSLVEGLENALRTQNPADFSHYGGRLADLLCTHIYKENTILFDLVERTISREADARLAHDMEEFDLAMQPGIYDELTHEVTRLERKYLGKAA